MSKQIAILLDNSGSMFNPVGGGNPNTKIETTSDGAEFFIENLVDELAANPGAEFAISAHRFASSYQLLPGGGQIDSSQGNFVNALDSMKGSIAAIKDQAAAYSAVGVMTDMYDAIRRVSDHLDNAANQPGFGAPDAKVIYLFTDGLQTISHGGLAMADYENEQGTTFENLLRARGIKLVAWGSGTDALGAALAELVDQAVLGGTNPQSDSKVLFPIDESGTFENCTTIIASNAIYIVSENGVLPLRPAGQPSSGLLWEQFSLPTFGPQVLELAAEPVAFTHHRMSVSAPPLVHHKDFEVDVDGTSRELVLGLVSHGRRERPTLEAVSPSGDTFASGTAGTRTVQVPLTAWALKIPSPEVGTWRVRVHNPSKRPVVFDLMARGVSKRFGFAAKAEPRLVASPETVKVVATPLWDGEPAAGDLEVSGRVLGGAPFELERQEDGSFAGKAEVGQPGTNIILVHLRGKLEASRATVERIAFAVVVVGRLRDPRFVATPSSYQQGSEYEVALVLKDAIFLRSSQVRFGDGIQVLDFEMLGYDAARARIRIDADAVPGPRIPVTYHPQAECLHPVEVVEVKDGRGVRGKICCLRFDASGDLVAVILCDDREVCIKRPSQRLLDILENAKERGWKVKLILDADGCLDGVEICH